MRATHDKSKVIQIFEYLRAVKNLSAPIVRDIDDYNDRLWWQKDLPIGDGCYLHGTGQNSDAWLEVHKQVVPPAPSPPSALAQWLINVGREPDSPPTYRQELTDEQGSMIRFSDSPARVEAWEKWLNQEWLPWAETALPKVKIQRLYSQLFSLYQRLLREGETLELVWGYGLLLWQVSGYGVRRPVLVTRMEMQFDAAKGIFALLPTATGTVLETEMLSSVPLPNTTRIVEMKQALSEEGIDPWDIDEVRSRLNEFVHNLSPDGRAAMQEEALSVLPSSPLILYSPVLILRRATGTGWIGDIEAIIEAIHSGHPVPATIAALTSTDPILPDESSQTEWQHVREDLLFPLPANEEQKDIVRRLASNTGVCVQGPPGTGKSHTIVNLISHLLAHGKRVLVTSQTERALRVLSDKIPEEIRPLCVSVLGGDARSTKELEDAIAKMSENLASLDRIGLQREISRLRQELSECRNRIARLQYDLKHSAEREHDKIEVEGKPLTALEVAKWLSSNEEKHGWFPNKLAPEVEPPLTDEQIAHFFELAGLLRKCDLEALQLNRPELERLPTASTLEQYWRNLKTQEDKVAACAHLLSGWDEANCAYNSLPEIIQLARKAAAQLERFNTPWLKHVLEDAVYGGKRREIWEDLVADCRERITAITSIERRIAEHRTQLPNSVPRPQLKDNLLTIRKELERKGTIKWFFRNVSGHRVKYLLTEAKVNDAPIRSVSDVDVLLASIECQELTERLLTKWNNTVRGVGAEELDVQKLRLMATIETNLDEIDLALNWHSTVCQPLASALKSLQVAETPIWTDVDWLQSLTQRLEALYEKKQLGDLRAQYISLLDYLSDGAIMLDAHEIWARLLRAFDERDVQTWDSALSELRRLSALVPLREEFDQLRSTLQKVAPQWVSRILAQGGQGEPLTPPNDWRTAWTWSRCQTWLHRLHTQCQPEEIQRQIEHERRKEVRLIERLVSASTWLRQIGRTTDEQRRSLTGWIQTIRRIGKGTGKYADRHRAYAKKEMEVCRDAVPVWIMPLHRVIENLRTHGEAFDVVIIDESSQSDIFALNALFRAKKAVIVGDDNQISPAAVGIDQSEVNALIERHLAGIPQAERLDLQTSIYDVALRIFPGQLMLKEHFRSVPEIVQFSNDLMYGGAIEPLRLPKRAERLEPPVIAVRVPEGRRDEGTKVINEPEAQALVAKIVECCQTPEYAERSIGVISLQGEEQARLIENLLRDSLGEVEMQRRRIICGDAYAFQGDERDVMFLSLVAASNVRVGALTRRPDMQRFNVAASRARDQMWLFYSIDLDELNSNDMRAHLLRYCLDPARVVRAEKEVEHLFDSDFERDVFRLIVARGYAVRPQVRVGKHRVDLVVEGLRARLAVECDGDKCHGVEQWEEDQQRQWILERAGWTFWRIRGSVFYLNPEKALLSLWEKLEEMGIEPSKKIESKQERRHHDSKIQRDLRLL